MAQQKKLKPHDVHCQEITIFIMLQVKLLTKKNVAFMQNLGEISPSTTKTAATQDCDNRVITQLSVG